MHGTHLSVSVPTPTWGAALILGVKPWVNDFCDLGRVHSLCRREYKIDMAIVAMVSLWQSGV